MKTIWKTILTPADVQEVSLPAGAEILCAGEQFEQICIWYRCDPGNAGEIRKIAIVGTGQTAPDDGRYIGTAALQGGSLIFHVFVWPR